MKTKVLICYSIVQKLHHRTITGRRLGLNVHRQSGKVLHFSWNKESKTGVYQNCIARKCSGLPLLLEIILPLRKSGLKGSCNCAYGTALENNEQIVGICFYHFRFFCFCHCRVSLVLEIAKEGTYLRKNGDLLDLQ